MSLQSRCSALVQPSESPAKHPRNTVPDKPPSVHPSAAIDAYFTAVKLREVVSPVLASFLSRSTPADALLCRFLLPSSDSPLRRPLPAEKCLRLGALPVSVAAFTPAELGPGTSNTPHAFTPAELGPGPSNTPHAPHTVPAAPMHDFMHVSTAMRGDVPSCMD